MKSKMMKLLAGASLLSLTALGAVPAGASPGPIVMNGSFTPGDYGTSYGVITSQGGTYEPLPANSTYLPGWTVSGTTADAVDWIGTYWSAPSGYAYSIDLNGGTASGSISQTLTTVPGATYVVSFSLAGNFDVSNYGASRMATVTATGGSPESFTFNEPTGWSHSSMGWQSETYQFTATSDSTTLTFTGDPNTSAWGPVISAVSAYMTPATSGAQCKDGGWQTHSVPGTFMPFANQGMCVSYFATAGDVPIGSANSN